MTAVLVSANAIQQPAYFLDARFNLNDSQAGKKQFMDGHIKGARHIDIEKDLSDMTSSEGRHPMPTKDQLAAVVHRLGLTYEQPIYIYDEGGQPFAARAYFMLQYAGFTNAYIVQEGYKGLVAAGFEVTTDVDYLTSTMPIQWNENVYVNREQVKEVARRKVNKVLLDARSASRYRGDEEPIDHVAGHIPTARNYDWEQLVQDGQLSVNETLTHTVSKDEQIIVYCGSGVTASSLYAMLKQLDYPNVQVYTGSFSDWINHEPIEQSEE
ncbi:thiosulfate sulfurtransferase [Kurthia sp. 3B1D]|uniref:Thiosulfate sulfurtransferase n=1 Tax=Candidatus Kurthia intestinigallinarum TaxID=1562256 RepID=A0A433RSN8_9BACL|nr:sulfurtransferase [Kurthia sp. 3B1D]RUS55158.1 thiosulfate sulfurtransferase [Kurthia sp. 3B1D]